jgi:hypothetical protein
MNASDMKGNPVRKPFKHVPSVKCDMLGAIIGREPFAYREQEPTKGGAVPKASPAFYAEISRRTEIVRTERAKIQKPSAKLTKREREHLSTFGFSAEQIRHATRISKKHGGRS